jgi:hypothetical protein
MNLEIVTGTRPNGRSIVHKFSTHARLAWGAYSDSSSVEVANVKSVMRDIVRHRKTVVRVFGSQLTTIDARGVDVLTLDDYDTRTHETIREITRAQFVIGILVVYPHGETLYIRENTDQWQDISEALDVFGEYDSEETSRVESEWLDSAIPDCLSDLARDIQRADNALEHRLGSWDSDVTDALSMPLYDAYDSDTLSAILRYAMDDANICATNEHVNAYISAQEVYAPFVKTMRAWDSICAHNAQLVNGQTELDFVV